MKCLRVALLLVVVLAVVVSVRCASIDVARLPKAVAARLLDAEERRDLTSSSCPNSCSGQGTCHKHHCTCNQGWAGNDCSIGISPLFINTPVTGEVGLGEWMYYSIGVESPSQVVEYMLSETRQEGVSSDCDMYLQVDHFPRRTDYAYRDLSLHADFSITVPSNATRGTWYVGIYGFLGCSFTLEAHEESSCPNSCSGHGVCDTGSGTCACTNGWGDVDCSVRNQTLVSGQAVQGNVERFRWQYFYLDVASLSALSFTLEAQLDCDLYVRKGHVPDLFTYDYANASSTTTSVIAIDEADPDRWYAGVFGYRACSFSLTGTASGQSSCPSRCSLHGTCSGTTCHCNPGFYDSACGTMDHDIPLGQGVQGYVDTSVWNYYTIATATQDNLRVSITQSGDEGDCDVFIRRGAYPSRTQYDVADVSLDKSFTVEVNDPGQATWYIGVVGWRPCGYTITVTETADCDCVAGHGTCSAGGVCVCTDGWGGPDCGTATNSMNSNQLYTGTVLPNQWQYYTLQANADHVSVVVRETDTTGDVWVYASQEDDPTLMVHDEADQHTNTALHSLDIPSLAPGQLVTFHIGVYGSPFANPNTPTPYQLSAWYLPMQPRRDNRDDGEKEKTPLKQ